MATTAQEETPMCDVIMASVREDSRERLRSRQERDEKLVTPAWYSMCLALQRQSLSEGPSPPGQAQSFLAQQRLSTQARRSLGLAPRILPR